MEMERALSGEVDDGLEERTGRSPAEVRGRGRYGDGVVDMFVKILYRKDYGTLIGKRFPRYLTN